MRRSVPPGRAAARCAGLWGSPGWRRPFSFAVLLLPARSSLTRVGSPAAATESSELSASDRADDALLNDVNRMARSDAGEVWNAFAGEPGESPVEEQRL